MISEICLIFDFFSIFSIFKAFAIRMIHLSCTLLWKFTMYGLKITNVEGEPYLCFDRSISAPGSSADEMLRA